MKNTQNNPQAMVMQMLSGNPDIQKVIQMTSGKSTGELKEIAQKLCEQKGINLDDFVKQLGMR